ncbi:CLUMA_CG008178, isoform A [Clunio marinus]|uniref:CLUMA_CG008178, isoform A n=1 Tax=Clunio marinus TaxID=568069 RepID=A0A1J1I6V3_9DIPT|nr:CLUMA_CG008178, isoform A [Clunio marinus]
MKLNADNLTSSHSHHITAATRKVMVKYENKKKLSESGFPFLNTLELSPKEHIDDRFCQNDKLINSLCYFWEYLTLGGHGSFPEIHNFIVEVELFSNENEMINLTVKIYVEISKCLRGVTRSRIQMFRLKQGIK